MAENWYSHTHRQGHFTPLLYFRMYKALEQHPVLHSHHPPPIDPIF